MRILKLFLAACACAVLMAPPVRGQDRALAQILERAAAYVDGFERQLTGIVAEETYVQDTSNAYSQGSHRELKSDLLLIRAAGEARYVEFRDVFEVDGRAVRDREDRLTRLFLDPSESATAQLRAIVAESARYNIGSVQRTLNMPTLPLIFLRSDNLRAAAFKATTKATPDLSRFSLASDAQSSEFASVPAGTAVVTFEEGTRNTLIRRAGGRDLPSRGRFWIDPATGRVLMTELIADDSAIVATIDVRYRLEPSMDVMVPAEMRERYNLFGKTPILGIARYSRFRRFQVQTSTDDGKPVK